MHVIIRCKYYHIIAGPASGNAHNLGVRFRYCCLISSPWWFMIDSRTGFRFPSKPMNKSPNGSDVWLVELRCARRRQCRTKVSNEAITLRRRFIFWWYGDWSPVLSTTRRRSCVEISEGVESFNSFTINDVIDNDDERPVATERQAERSGHGRDASQRWAKQSPLIRWYKRRSLTSLTMQDRLTSRPCNKQILRNWRSEQWNMDARMPVTRRERNMSCKILWPWA